MKFNVALILFFAIAYSPTSSAEDCDGQLSATGPLGCHQSLNHEYSKNLINLFKFGLLDSKTHSIRGTCDCTAKGNLAYCSATFNVHQCFHGASGTIWFSANSIIEGGVYSSWDAASERPDNDLPALQASVARNAAEGLIERVKAKSQR